MQIIEKDDSRRIDLPGVGPCPRPVDIDQSVTGFTTLKSLRIYKFAPDAVIEGESEIDEVFVVPVSGQISLEISGIHPCTATLGEGGDAALYMTPLHAYQLTPQSATEVAYVRAEAKGDVPSQTVSGAASSGLAERLAFRIVDLKAGESLSLGGKETLAYCIDGQTESIIAGQTLALAEGESAKLTATADSRLFIVTA